MRVGCGNQSIYPMKEPWWGKVKSIEHRVLGYHTHQQVIPDACTYDVTISDRYHTDYLIFLVFTPIVLVAGYYRHGLALSLSFSCTNIVTLSLVSLLVVTLSLVLPLIVLSST